MTLVVAIDGPAGAGKTTTARGVAERLGWRYLDTGALYRALALAVLRSDVKDPLGPEAVRACKAAAVRPEWRGSEMRVFLGDEDVSETIRSPEVTRLVSPLSALPEVRAVLLAIQREAGRRGRIVVEGRDIGSVVFPDAAVKVFLTADLDERARRRRAELEAAGIPAGLEEIRARIEERDRRDAGRETAPLRRAEGAVVLDTTGLTIDEQIEKIVRLAREAAG
ncbi:MAG: (d)CMP kinase [Candidatus Latescibacterota bacterium]|nr:MAG: (d)CMP kinase [Candidatus Latescibacterota bacterium]